MTKGPKCLQKELLLMVVETQVAEHRVIDSLTASANMALLDQLPENRNPL